MESMHKPYSHLKLGIIYILLAWLFFTIMATFTRFATKSQSLGTVLFFQNFIGFLSTLPWVYHHGIASLKTNRIGLIFVRSIAGLLSFTCLFLAVQRTSLVDSILLNNASPLILPFLIRLWLKVPINHRLWPGIGVGFVGILLILQPGKEILDPGALFGLGAAATGSVVMVSVRLLSYTERHHTVLFYYFAIASAIVLPWMIMKWDPLSTQDWIYLGAIGLCSTFGQWMFIRAFHNAKPSQIGPFCYMAVVYSAILDWALWGSIPNLLAWTGIILVCLGGIWTIRYSAQPKT